MNKCKGIFGRLFGHNYQPVFNRHPPALEDLSVERGSSRAIMGVIDSMTRTEYVHTCCTRCGDVIEAVMP